MAATSFQYGLFTKSTWQKETSLATDVIKAMLVTSAYVFNQDTHQYKSSITNEVVGTGYVAGGAVLGSTLVTYTPGTNTTNFTAQPTVWGTSTITARGAVVYDSTPGSDATRPLICFVDFGIDQISSGGNFTITWDPAGIIATITS